MAHDHPESFLTSRLSLSTLQQNRRAGGGAPRRRQQPEVAGGVRGEGTSSVAQFSVRQPHGHFCVSVRLRSDRKIASFKTDVCSLTSLTRRDGAFCAEKKPPTL